jgi:hypothetical protein
MCCIRPGLGAAADAAQTAVVQVPAKFGLSQWAKCLLFGCSNRVNRCDPRMLVLQVAVHLWARVSTQCISKTDNQLLCTHDRESRTNNAYASC